jgi:predicted ester cyclase
MYFKYIATHTGEFLGVAPTGKKITLYGIVTWRIVDGKIVEKGPQVWDFMDIYKQLGIIEYTEKGRKLFPEQ